MKHFNIPIFVSHLGCPNTCVFCNQHKINGVDTDLTKDDIIKIIDENLSTIRLNSNKYVELAFFGGSFTGIEIDKQIDFLETVQPYIDTGDIDSIRISTRPDYINEDIIKRLEKYNVNLIELGIQSFDEQVLECSKRGHTVQDIYNAIKIIKNSKIDYGIQLMPGLPSSNLKKDIYSAKKVADLTPKTVRIYPTLVIKESELETLFYAKKYMPLSIDDAVYRSAIMASILYLKNINIIRIGLQPSDELRLDGNVIAGPFHPAFRELVEGEILYQFLRDIKSNIDTVEIIANPKNFSKIVGINKRNRNRLTYKIKLISDNQMSLENIVINEKIYSKSECYKKIIDRCGEIYEANCY